MVTVVLVCFALASLPGCIFGLMGMKGEGGAAKEMKELAESGIETQARLVELVPFGKLGFAHVAYEFRTPDGRSAVHRAGANFGPAHVVGDSYPLVHHPQKTKIVVMGTMSNVRKERRYREGGVRQAKLFALGSLLAGVLAVTGLVLGH